MAPNGTRRMQLDVNSLPRLSASWSPPPTPRQWAPLTSECVPTCISMCPKTTYWITTCILFQCSNSIMWFCALAAWPASRKPSSRRWQPARELWWNALRSWRRRVGLAQVQDTCNYAGQHISGNLSCLYTHVTYIICGCNLIICYELIQLCFLRNMPNSFILYWWVNIATLWIINQASCSLCGCLFMAVVIYYRNIIWWSTLFIDRTLILIRPIMGPCVKI